MNCDGFGVLCFTESDHRICSISRGWVSTDSGCADVVGQKAPCWPFDVNTQVIENTTKTCESWRGTNNEWDASHRKISLYKSAELFFWALRGKSIQKCYREHVINVLRRIDGKGDEKVSNGTGECLVIEIFTNKEPVYRHNLPLKPFVGSVTNVLV